MVFISTAWLEAVEQFVVVYEGGATTSGVQSPDDILIDFTDVTRDADLLDAKQATHSVVWADIDNDG